MNARQLKDFFASPQGRILAVFILFAFFLAFAWLFYGSKQGQTKVETVQTSISRAHSGIEDLANDVPRYRAAPAHPSAPPPPPVVVQQGPPPEVIPIGIGRPAASDTPYLSTESAPYGRLIKCKLLITVDSSAIATPIIGIVTEDVYNSYGDLIIPAGSEVHGKAQADRVRERIGSDNSWVIVFNTHDEEELKINGDVLDEDVSPDGDSWGITDGSAGLRGTVIKSDKFAELKIFAATFLSAGITGLQSQGTDGFTGTQTYENTPRNAALGGASAVINQYAESILDTVKRDGFFVRVPAGKQFYLYATQPIDRENAQRGDSLFHKDTDSVANAQPITPTYNLPTRRQ